MRVAVIASVIVALVLGGAPAAHPQAPAPVRVGLMLGVGQVTLSADQPLEVVDAAGDRREQLSPNVWAFRPTNGGIEIPFVTRYSDVVRVRNMTGGPVRVEERNRRYRGAIELRRTERGLVAINELPIDEYLYGVMRMEVSPAWPVESLKAQAVAARTLAISSIGGRFAREGYDVRDTVDSQVYGGLAGEDPRTNAAVDATRGLVITHRGQIVFSPFHADSGGRTEHSELVWGTAMPHLRSVDDPFVAGAPYERWLRQLPLVAIEERLRAAGVSVSGLTGVAVARTSDSGRALSLALQTREGPREITGHRFRTILGPDVVRSTIFAVRVEEGVATFEGRGWGHGVGMSQWGARGMAAAGQSYVQILRHYYAGVDVTPR